ncbi:hypothetical protein P7K49_000694 [Saguinus oedipus]|uniref:CKK domain-containing protein n=1 Tax=Saguinus oedipus TaxID=9490 RepID=A0ABQ9WCC8_SAGOE|nr:hypothetical protein P7K49_000694 [Saguinus oedipus]
MRWPKSRPGLLERQQRLAEEVRRRKQWQEVEKEQWREEAARLAHEEAPGSAPAVSIVLAAPTATPAPAARTPAEEVPMQCFPPSIGAQVHSPRLYKEPSAKSNKFIIHNALSHCCLVGKVNELQNRILEEIEKSKANHFLILFCD